MIRLRLYNLSGRRMALLEYPLPSVYRSGIRIDNARTLQLGKALCHPIKAYRWLVHGIVEPKA